MGASAALTAGLTALPAFPTVVHWSSIGAGAAIWAGGGWNEAGKGSETSVPPVGENGEAGSTDA